MEAILTFVLGVVVGLLLIGSVAAFKVFLKVKESVSDIKTLWKELQERDRLINQRVDGEISRHDKAFDDIYRSMDSRMDKLDSKLNAKISDVFNNDKQSGK
jgi:hypothetical protein